MKSTITIGGTTLAVESFTLHTADCPMPWTGCDKYTIDPTTTEAEITVTIEPGAWIDILCLSRYGVTFAELVEALECRRWFRRGSPLAAWYRDRPSWRVADTMGIERN